MSIIAFRKFLTERNVDGLRKYKYSAVDDSPFSLYLIKPIYMAFVEYIPAWIHPNLLTLSGGFCVLLAFVLMISKMDFQNFDPLIFNPAIDQKFFAGIALLMFLAHHFDGLDGVLARRLAVSSPIGELLDHGVDSLSVLMIVCCFFLTTGTKNLFLLVGFFSTTFFISHWEKKYTGTFFLPWGYDLSMLSCFGYYFFLSLLPNSFQLLKTTHLLWYAEKLTIFWVICQLISLLLQALWRIHKKFVIDNDNSLSYFHKMSKPITELVSHLFTYIVFVIWFKNSPNELGPKCTHIFVWSYSMVFSHQTFHMILHSITGSSLPRCKALSRCKFDISVNSSYFMNLFTDGTCFLPGLIFSCVTSIIGGSILGKSFELLILNGFCIFVTVKHFHFMICIFRQLCMIFNKSFIFV